MADKKKILVVDDDYEIVEFVKMILKTKGYDICVAYDGEEGLAQVTKERPDLVVLDLKMPKMSGMEFCRQLRRNPDPELAATVVIVISSLPAEMGKPDKFWMEGLGCDDILPKPFDPLALLGRVEYLLRKGEYVSDIAADADKTPAPGKSGPSSQPPPETAGAPPTGPNSDPEEVVRTFVESWNTRDFAREYDALGDEMTGGLSRPDYIQRRAQLYADENGSEMTCTVLDTSAEVSSQAATVACLREDTVKGTPWRKDERYTLRLSPNGWKIVSVRSRPMTFNID